MALCLWDVEFVEVRGVFVVACSGSLEGRRWELLAVGGFADWGRVGGSEAEVDLAEVGRDSGGRVADNGAATVVIATSSSHPLAAVA